MALLSQFVRVPRNFRYWPEISGDYALYDEADCYVKWLCSANFCVLHGTLKFSMMHDAIYHEADHCMKWPHSANVRISWSRPAEDAHYNDVIMDTIASQITSLTIVYSIVYSDADQRKHQSSASLVFVRGINRDPHTNGHWRGRCFHLTTSSWSFSERPVALCCSGHGLTSIPPSSK